MSENERSKGAALHLSQKSLLGLDALNFFLADVRDGLGPYLAIYLIAVRGPDQGWNEATTGLVMTIAGLVGLIVQTPAGALVDRSRHKRTIVIVGALAVTLSCLSLPFISNFYLVTATQSVAGIAGAIFPPALAAITLGMVGPKLFSKRIGRNEGFNHAGNAVSAAIAGGTAYFFGPIVVFYLMGLLAVCSVAATLIIPSDAIDDDVARGLDSAAKTWAEQPSGPAALLQNKHLMIFALLAAIFHLSNAAMLTSVGQLLTKLSGKENATSLISVCIVAAQFVMVPVAIFVGAQADAIGRKPIFLVAFGVLAVRGVLYTFSDNPFYLVGVQLLDGIGAGIYGALFPVVVADLTRGTGHFNVSQGAVATTQGLGAALSATLAGLVIVSAGYSTAFLVLAVIAGGGFILYLVAMPETVGSRPPTPYRWASRRRHLPLDAARQPYRRTDGNRMSQHDDLLVYAHIGDLHLTKEDEQNYKDFGAIVSELAGDLRDGFDFVYVPGDNADNGLPPQYALAGRQLARLPMPVHIVTGDHDMEPGCLDNFYHSLDVAPLPKAVDAGGVRCLFLDICGPGKGGPDFRIGDAQSKWLRNQLTEVKRQRKRCAIFMHSYPADLKSDGEVAAINLAFSEPEILLVDMGHTHYNELANDGRTIFTATRSTGQIEEGPVGYSITTIDRRAVSWRFRTLGASLPVVLITAPVDRRLVTDADDPDHWPKGTCEVRVCVLGPRPIVHCTCSIDDRGSQPMSPMGKNRFVHVMTLPDAARTIHVKAQDDRGGIGRETIELARDENVARTRHANGSDADAIGAWEERGIFGTQLGPNRNGRHW